MLIAYGVCGGKWCDTHNVGHAYRAPRIHLILVMWYRQRDNKQADLIESYNRIIYTDGWNQMVQFYL